MDGRYKNVSMVLHVTGLILFAMFKNKIFDWLQMNNVFLNMTICYNTKETVTRIGHLTMIHLKRIYCAACQERLNKALATVASELDEENKNYFSDYGTTLELANYN
eukprot:3788961-Ditylum_brightwellii.AAC.1